MTDVSAIDESLARVEEEIFAEEDRFRDAVQHGGDPASHLDRRRQLQEEYERLDGQREAIREAGEIAAAIPAKAPPTPPSPPAPAPMSAPAPAPQQPHTHAGPRRLFVLRAGLAALNEEFAVYQRQRNH